MLKEATSILILGADRTKAGRIRSLLTKNIAQATVSQAPGDKSSLDAIRQNHPDLVLLNLDGSDGNGLGLIKRIVGEFSLPVIVIMDAGATDRQLIAALEAGACDYAFEPVMAEELTENIYRALREERDVV